MNDHQPFHPIQRPPLRPTLRPIVLVNLLLGMLAVVVGFALSQSFRAQAAPQAEVHAAPALQIPANPAKHNYQGLLYENDGSLVNGTFDITVNIYDSVAGGTPLWSDTFNDVKIRDGLYNVVLGSQAALGTVLLGAPRYIGTSLDGKPEFFIRERMHPVPWAIYADIAETTDYAPTADTATDASTSPTAANAVYTDFLDPLISFTYVNANQNGATPASVNLAVWQAVPNGYMCGLYDLYTPLDVAPGDGALQLDCRIDATTKTVIAGRASYCSAMCLRLKPN